MGKILMIGGAAIFLIGLLLVTFPQAISWFGKLPGDFRYESERTAIYFPLSSMIILSVLASLILSFMSRGK